MLLQYPTNLNDSEHKILEGKVRQLWCSLLHLDKIPDDDSTTWFALGGSSTTLMQLFNLYQLDLISHRQLNRLDFLTQPTIAQHIHLLTTSETRLHHAIQGPASFAPEHIWLGEREHFTTASLLVFIVSPGSFLSLQRLNRALALLISKHPTLRIRLMATSDGSSMLHQCVAPFNNTEIMSFVQVSNVESANEEQAILVDEETNRTHFDLTTGRIFRCHAIRRSNENDEDLLTDGDVLLFNFHHAILDHFTEFIFLTDLREAYSTSTLDVNDDHTPIYIPYALWEQDSRDDNRPSASDFEHQLQLPYDRRPSMSTRTGRASLVNLKLDRDESLVTFACQAQVTLFQVYLSAYYVFLYKLTQCQDLIVDSRVTNWSQYEVIRTISMSDRFVPIRLCRTGEKFCSFDRTCEDDGSFYGREY